MEREKLERQLKCIVLALSLSLAANDEKFFKSDFNRRP